MSEEEMKLKLEDLEGAEVVGYSWDSEKIRRLQIKLKDGTLVILKANGSVSDYSIRIFSTRMKKKIIEFLSLFNLQERALMSLGGVDPKTIYTNIKWSVNCDEGVGFLLFKENVLVGLATIYKLNRSVVVLGLLAIKPSEQRKGLGAFLLKYVFGVAKLNGVKEIRAKVVKENVKAISFYKKFDFIFAGGEGAYLISKTLVSSID